MTKPTKWHVRIAMTQISRHICLVWSESSLFAVRSIRKAMIDAQAGLGLRRMHSYFVCFVKLWLRLYTFMHKSVNCWIVIHCLEVSCKEDQITSASDLSAYNWPTSSHDDGCLTLWLNRLVNNISVPEWGREGRLLVNLVPMLEQKKWWENVLFFQAGQCAALSSFRVRKNSI